MITLSIKELLLIVGFGSLGAAASMLMLIMIGQVNQKLPVDQRMSYFRWGPVRQLHRQLYPNSKLVLAYDLCTAGIVLCFLVAIVVSG